MCSKDRSVMRALDNADGPKTNDILKNDVRYRFGCKMTCNRNIGDFGKFITEGLFDGKTK